MKTCSRCGEQQPEQNFCKNRRAADGLSYRCRACESARRKPYNANQRALAQEFYNLGKQPNETLRDFAVRYFCETEGVIGLSNLIANWVSLTLKLSVTTDWITQQQGLRDLRSNASNRTSFQRCCKSTPTGLGFGFWGLTSKQRASFGGTGSVRPQVLQQEVRQPSSPSSNPTQHQLFFEGRGANTNTL